MPRIIIPFAWFQVLLKKKSILQETAFLVLLLLGLVLRGHDLDKYPQKYQTLDEYHYLWAGLSLIDEGKPVAWSKLSGYTLCGVQPRPVLLPDCRLTIVCPAMDHPPLFSIVAGAFARLSGAHRVLVPQPDGSLYRAWDISLGQARCLSLLLFAISYWLLFHIALQAFSFPVAVLSSLFYATTAFVVFHNRLLVTENLSTPLLLLNVLFVQRYVAGKSSRSTFAAVTIITTAAALLCKLVAVSQAAAVIAMLLFLRHPRDIVFPIWGAAVGLLLYLIYGWWQGWDVFWTILMNQASRFQGLNCLAQILLQPLLVHTPRMSYLLLLGWISLFALSFHRLSANALLVAPLAYLLSFGFFASVPAIYGWHVLPFYPFLCLALGLAVVHMLRQCTPAIYLACAALLLPPTLDIIAYPGTKPMLTLARYSYLLSGACVFLILLFPVGIRRRMMQAILSCLVFALVLHEIWQVWTHQPWR